MGAELVDRVTTQQLIEFYAQDHNDARDLKEATEVHWTKFDDALTDLESGGTSDIQRHLKSATSDLFPIFADYYSDLAPKGRGRWNSFLDDSIKRRLGILETPND